MDTVVYIVEYVCHLTSSVKWKCENIRMEVEGRDRRKEKIK